MAVLVIADHDGSAVRDTTNKTVTAALAIGGDVDLLVVGSGAKAAADSAAKITGVRKVLLAESAGLGHQLAEDVEETVLALAGGYDAILSPATNDGKNFMPRLAAKLDVAPISDIVEVVSADTFVRPIYAGNALETVQSSDAKKVITVRPTGFTAAADGGSASVETVPGVEAGKASFVGEELVKSDRPELGAAPRSSSRAVAPWARRKSSMP
jgi:electron transfer flavoprotein alpha subunit